MMDTPELETRNASTARRDSEEARRELAEGAGDLAATLGNKGVGKVLTSSGVARSASGQSALDESVARAIEERRGKGSPLPEDVRGDMEGRLGSDLSDVRVHTDADAHSLNESVAARAFTVGSDVFFKQGSYSPGSTDGEKLLAHELTHVVQQGGSSAGTPTTVSDPNEASEQQADAVAEAITSPSVDTTPAAAARQEEEEEVMASADLSRQAEEEEEVMPSADVARQSEEEEELLQGSFETGAVSRETDDLDEEMA
jgi:hypothetical protein